MRAHKKIRFLGIGEVGEKKLAEKERKKKRERKSVLNAWTNFD